MALHVANGKVKKVKQSVKQSYGEKEWTRITTALRVLSDSAQTFFSKHHRCFKCTDKALLRGL